MAFITGVVGVIVPVRIVVGLVPSGRHALIPPPHTGPAVFYAVLNALRNSAGGTRWATVIHDAASHRAGTAPHKQIACTSLLDEQDRPVAGNSQRVRFEVGVLQDELTAPLLVALKETADIRIANRHYRIADLDVVEARGYPDLRSDAQPAVSWSMRLLSPVAFESTKHEGARRLRPLPEPEWVFGSLLARWQTLAVHTPLHEDTAGAIALHLAVADWSLSRQEHLVLPADPGKNRKDPLIWSGSVGAVTYRLADAEQVSPAVRASIDALVRFAAYAGIGDRTNVGMGYVRPSAISGRA